MNTTHTHTECIPQQIRVFTKWVSNNLSKVHSNVKINDITKDLQNGVALIELTEILVGKLAPRDWDFQPKQTDGMAHNNDVALNMLIKDGVHLKGISGKEVNENKEKFILGLVWTLILHYSINKSICFNNDKIKINNETKFSSKSKVTHATSCALLD